MISMIIIIIITKPTSRLTMWGMYWYTKNHLLLLTRSSFDLSPGCGSHLTRRWGALVEAINDLWDGECQRVQQSAGQPRHLLNTGSHYTRFTADVDWGKWWGSADMEPHSIAFVSVRSSDGLLRGGEDIQKSIFRYIQPCPSASERICGIIIHHAIRGSPRGSGYCIAGQPSTNRLSWTRSGYRVSGGRGSKLVQFWYGRFGNLYSSKIERGPGTSLITPTTAVHLAALFGRLIAWAMFSLNIVVMRWIKTV